MVSFMDTMLVCVRTALLLAIGLLAACQSLNNQQSLYDELGGMPAIEEITGNFIYEIGMNEPIAKHFEDTDLDRFYNKMVEHLCEVSGGPCEYTGDSMIDVHTNMNINEAEFNQVVDLLINALNRSGIPHRTQNKLLARLAPLREEMIYR